MSNIFISELAATIACLNKVIFLINLESGDTTNALLNFVYVYRVADTIVRLAVALY